jgi:hypothetical protein
MMDGLSRVRLIFAADSEPGDVTGRLGDAPDPPLLKYR